jgi:2,5-dioxopentanoate dehydrogenase
MAELTGASFIGGARHMGSGEKFHALNPATGEPLSPAYGSVGAAEVGKTTGTDAIGYSRWSGKQRGALLRAIAARIETSAEPIITRANLETALPLPRLQGELARTCNQLRMFAALVEEGSWVDARIDHADAARKPVSKPDVRSMLRPLGRVAVFGASNFPLAFSVAGGDTASALAAGCPVIVKAHPAHPGTSELVGNAIVEAVREIGAPDGVFSLLFDAGHDIGTLLVKDHSVSAVAFTGSRRGGLALMALAASREEPIPIYAEMGSVNPVCIFAGAQRERAKEIAPGLHASVTLGVGQFCTNPGVVFVEECEATEAFLAELDRLFAASPAGVMLTPGICRSYVSGVDELTSRPGVRVRARDAKNDHPGLATPTLVEVEPLNFYGDRSGMDEIFGPVTVIVRCPNAHEVGHCLGWMRGELTVSVHASEADSAEVQRLFGTIESLAGRIVLNAFPTGVEVCHAMVHGGPFPATGDGRSTSVGTRAIERFTRPVCYQGFADNLLPPELQESNPLSIWRLVDGERHR